MFDSDPAYPNVKFGACGGHYQDGYGSHLCGGGYPYGCVNAIEVGQAEIIFDPPTSADLTS